MTTSDHRVPRFPKTPAALAAMVDGLPSFCARLRETAGFSIDTSQAITATRLLLDLAGRDDLPADLADLAGRFGLILCASPEELSSFPERFEQWLSRIIHESPAKTEPGSVARTDGDQVQANPAADQIVNSRRRVLRSVFVLGAGLLVMLSCLTIAVNFGGGDGATLLEKISHKDSHKSEQQKKETGNQKTGNAQPTPTTKTVTPDVPPDVPAFGPHSGLTGSDWPFGLRLALAGGLLIVFSVTSSWGLLRWFGRGWDQAVAVLRRGQPGETDRTAQAFRPGKVAVWSADERLAIREAARALRNRVRTTNPDRIDIRRTLERAVRSAWPVVAVPETRHVAIEHVAMVDRESALDHAADLADAMLDALEREQVAVVRFAFTRDPRYLVPRPRGVRACLLEEVAGPRHGPRLLLWTDGAGLIDPHTGRPGAMAARLTADWPRCVILTPIPPDAWSVREAALLDKGYAVAHATPRGLRHAARWLADDSSREDVDRDEPGSPGARRGVPLADPDDRVLATRLPTTLRAEPRRWLAPVVPDPEEVRGLLGDLRRYLGSDFAWLAGCAAYPEISWRLTLVIGQDLGRIGHGTGREAGPALARLARLPWFRHGSMPEWIRLILLADLAVGDRERVKCILDRLLTSSSLDELPSSAESSSAQLAFGLPAELRQALLTHPSTPSYIASDRVVVNFLLGREPSLLDVPLPDKYRRLLTAPKAPADRKIGRPVNRSATPIRDRFVRLLGEVTARRFAERMGESQPGWWSARKVLGAYAALLALTLLPAVQLTRPGLFSPRWPGVVFPVAAVVVAGWQAAAMALPWALARARRGGGNLAATIMSLWTIVPLGLIVVAAVIACGTTLATALAPGLPPITAQAVFRDALRNLGPWSDGVVVLKGHKQKVTRVAFVRDGSRIATASEDGTARVWDAASGRRLLTLEGNSDWVNGVAFSPDGSRIATASDDRTARVWDASSGKILLELSGHDGSVVGVAFSPDGRRIATASKDGTARVWDAASGQGLLSLEGRSVAVNGLAFSPDGRRIATASKDGTARIWDAASGQMLLSLEGAPAR